MELSWKLITIGYLRKRPRYVETRPKSSSVLEEADRSLSSLFLVPFFFFFDLICLFHWFYFMYFIFIYFIYFVLLFYFIYFILFYFSISFIFYFFILFHLFYSTSFILFYFISFHLFYFFLFYFMPHLTACRILVP